MIYLKSNIPTISVKFDKTTISPFRNRNKLTEEIQIVRT